jgi:uncharacterized membrane protein YgcG
MPDAFELHDAHFISDRAITSGAGALTITGPTVPAKKVWTILGASYSPSVAETRTVCWFIVTRAATYIAISFPTAILLPPGNWPLLTQGMELKLFPGEALYVNRDVATAGSTITLAIRYIETDLPFYSYEEPLKKVVKAAARHGSVYRSSGGISTGGGSGGGGHDLPGGGGGGPESV